MSALVLIAVAMGSGEHFSKVPEADLNTDSPVRSPEQDTNSR
jgi:hypothetical protein